MSLQRIDVDGAGLAVAVSGAASGSPLCLVNGATTNLTSWAPILPRLEERFRVIRHDVRGTGESTAGGDPAAFDIADYADDLAAILDALGISKSIVCGMAFGARIALQFAVRHPDKLQLLALYDATYGPPAGLERRKAGAATARAKRAEAGLGELVRDPAWFKQRDPESARAAFTAAARQPDQRHVLASVHVPTLLATGDCDDNLPASRLMAEAIPDAEFHLMAMCGHGSLFERPEMFADLLLAFVARRDAGNP
jgi:pimeloyl-ACP methyl ester carboxylesterase